MPNGAPAISHGPNAGQHWVHLKSAEQLAKALYENPFFDIRKIYRRGGISEGDGKSEGLVGLYDRQGRLLLLGSYICGCVQWPVTPSGMIGAACRETFREALDLLDEVASSLLAPERPREHSRARNP